MRGEEPRHRVGAAFDQHPLEATLGERGEYRGRRDTPLDPRQRHDLDASRSAGGSRTR